MRTALGIVMFVGGCGSAATPASAVDHARGAPAAAPCPDDARLLELATAAWAPHTEPDGLWCQALRVGDDTQWWIAGFANVPEAYGASPHQALVLPSGFVLWTHADEYSDYHPTGTDSVAGDLDHDGVDELLYVEQAGEGGGVMYTLVVVGVAGGAPHTGVVSLGSYYQDEGCQAEWAVDGETIVVSGEGECADLSGRFRWDGSTLVTAP